MMAAEASARCFPDQGAKLYWLISIRADQRARSRSKKGFARQPSDGGHPRDHDSPLVVNQAGLAAFLEASEPTVSRWCRDRVRIPDRHLGELCRLYAIRESDFRTCAFVTFVALYGDVRTVTLPDTPALAIAWRLLLRAASGHIEILSSLPPEDASEAAHINRLRFATASSHADIPVPAIVQGKPFWLRLASPQRADAELAWAGWHLALFNHDIGRDAFRALLPRETNDPAHWSPLVPVTGFLTLPRAEILRHEAPDLGEFGIVAVLTREPLPALILDTLAQERAHGLTLEPALEELASHLATSVRDGDAALAETRYVVVPPTVTDRDA